MGTASVIQHKGCGIIFIDFRNCSDAEMLRRIPEAQQFVAKQAPKSALTLTDVTGTKVSEGITNAMRDYTRANKPFVRAAAVVGLDPFKRIVVLALSTLTGRKLETFDDLEKAKDWLAKIP